MDAINAVGIHGMARRSFAECVLARQSEVGHGFILTF